MQKKVLVYGTGLLTQKYLPALSLEYEIIGFIQSDGENNLKSYFSKPVIQIDDLASLQFDFIVICSNDEENIQNELLKCDVANISYIGDLKSVKELAMDISRSNVEKQVKILESMAPPALSRQHIDRCKLLTDRDELLKKMKPDSIAAELGVAAGEYSRKIIESVNPEILHLIDLWSSARFGEDLMNEVQELFSENIAQGQVNVHRLTSIDAAALFEDNYFDWVYIDTDHSYQTTLAELRLYKNKIKPDGYLMGHDYVMGNWKKHLKYGVIEAVHQFCVEEGFELAYLTMELNQSYAIRKISN